MIDSGEGRELLERARLEYNSPPLAQVEQWANEQLHAFDPEGHFDRNDYVHAFIALHETLEDARVESLYVAQYPEATAAFASLAEKAIRDYEGSNPGGPYMLAVTRPYVSPTVRRDLRERYIDALGEEDLNQFTAIFSEFLSLGNGPASGRRKELVQSLIYAEMPEVIGLSFDSGDSRTWDLATLIDMTGVESQELFRNFIQAAVAEFKVEGTLDSGDVVLVEFDPAAPDLWLSPGLRLLASSKIGKVWGQLNGMELSATALSALSRAGWEIISPGGPEAFATKEWWTRQAAEVAVETLWIMEEVVGHPLSTPLRIVGSGPAREAWHEVFENR